MARVGQPERTVRWAPVWVLVGVLAVPALAEAGRAYVSNEDGQTVTVIDTDKAEAVATIAVGKRPRGMKLSRDGSRLYVAVSGLPKCPPTVPDEECAKFERDLNADGIAVIDTASLKLIRVLKAGSDPEQFDLSTDGRLLFVANEDSAQASVLDVDSGTIKARIPVGKEPEGVSVSPDGRWVLVTSESDNAVAVIDARTFKVVRTAAVGHRPRDAAFTADSRTAYVSGEFDSSLYRMSITDGTSVERLLELRKEARPMAVVLDPARGRLYLSTGRGGTVAVVELAGPKLVTEIPVGTRPWGMALSQDGKILYTANGPSNDLSVVDTTTLQVIRKIQVGRSPWGVVLGPAPPAGGSATAPIDRAAHDYPTDARVEYVQECMLRHGGELAYLYKCSCAIDRMANELTYDDFVDMGTFARNASLAGERGGVFRDSDEARQETKRYRDVEAQAYRACGLTASK